MPYDYAKKLQAMLAKAASTPSAEEADTIMQMVNEMMRKHGISLLDLQTHLSDDPVGIADPELHYWAADKWKRPLLSALSFLYGVRVYYTASGNKTTLLINGRESCRVTFTLMAPYLIKTVQRVAAKAFREGRYSSLSKANRDVGAALANRVWRLYHEQKAAAGPRAVAGLNALVPVDVIETVEFDAFGGPVEVARNGKRKGTTKYAKLLAEEISLAAQVGEVMTKDRLLA